MKYPKINCISFLRRKTNKDLLCELGVYAIIWLFYTVVLSFTMWAIFYTIAEYGFNGVK